MFSIKKHTFFITTTYIPAVSKAIRGQCTFHLLIQEITPGHTNAKMFAYTGKRMKRKVPNVRTLPDGRTVTVAYDTRVVKRSI